MDFHTLKSLQTSTISDAATKFFNTSTGMHNYALDWNQNVLQPTQSHWQGTAADTALQQLSRTKTRLETGQGNLQAIGRTLVSAADDLARVQQALANLVSEAVNNGFDVADDGTLVPIVYPFGLMDSDDDKQRKAQFAERYTGELATILEEATSMDHQFAAVIQKLTSDANSSVGQP